MANKGEATLLLKIKTMGQEALDSVQESFDTMKMAGLAAFTAISAAIYKSIADYQQQEEATNALTQAMVNNGIYSKQLKDDYLAQATALQKLTTYGDEQIIAAQASLQMMIGEQQVTQGLTMAVLNLATAKKMDLGSAAELVGKTISSNNNILARQGVEFDNNTRGAERLAAVTDALERKFGGQAQAATDGLGALKQLNNAISDLAELVGERLAPYINLFATSIKNMAENTNSVTPIMDALIATFNFVAMYAIDATQTVKALGMAIGVGLSTAVAASQQALEGNFRMALETVKTGFQTIQDEAIRYEQEGQAATEALFAVEEARKQQQFDKELEMLRQSKENQKTLKATYNEEENAQILADLEAKQIQKDLDNEMTLAKMAGQNEKELDLQLKKLEQQYKNEENFTKKKELLQAIAGQKEKIFEQQKNQQLEKDRQDFYTRMISMQNSSNSVLGAVGKAFALRQIAIETPVAIAKAFSAFPPPFNVAAAGLVAAQMAQQAAAVAGVQLAEGGVVMPRAGGVQATIAEAGQPEVVIPLDRAQEFGLGGGGASITLNVYGGLLGDERTATELAVAIDRKLLELRQNGGSVAFDRIT